MSAKRAGGKLAKVEREIFKGAIGQRHPMRREEDSLIGIPVRPSDKIE
jgi:hypothetical protein